MLSAARLGLAPVGAPERWLVGLRWIAVIGMLATTLIGGTLVPELAVGHVVTALGGIVLLNFAWMAWLRQRGTHGDTVAPQILGDVVALATVLWLSGGLGNPFAAFLVFQIVLAGLIGTRRTTLAVTVVALVAAAVLWVAPPLELRSSGGRDVELLARLVALMALGMFMALFVFVYAHRIESLREQSERAERLASLGRTVGAMCHELNTPLGTILIAGKDLALMGRELGSTEIEELAETVADDARRASDIIGLMRGSLSPDARKMVVALGGFVRRHAEAELDRLGYHGERRLLCDDATEVVVIDAALRRVLTNLLTNAVDATSQTVAPRITVEVGPTSDALGSDGAEQVEVRITDNGPGVRRDLVERLGEPFQTTKADRGGTGLGLYVSNLLAERMGGSLVLETVVGAGTSLCLTLPRASQRRHSNGALRAVSSLEAPEPAEPAQVSP